MNNTIWLDSWNENTISDNPETFFPIKDNRQSQNISATEKRVQERKIINPFDPRYMEILKKADVKQHLNWEAPEQLKQILSPFLPHYTKKTLFKPKKTNLSRYERKQLAKNPVQKIRISHADALLMLLTQIKSDIKEKRIDNTLDPSAIQVDFSGARQIKEENKIRARNENDIRADFYRTLKDIWLPKHMFFTAPLQQIEELAGHYLSNKESVNLMKNYTHDIMKSIILPAFEKRETSSFNEQNQIYQKLVDLCYKVCFSHKNREWNLHPHVLTSYVVEWDEPWLKISNIRWALSEAYGRYVLENMNCYVTDPAFTCVPLSMQDNARRVLDLHAKSDAVYKISWSDNAEMIWAVDFKNRWERKEAGEMYSSLDIDNDDTTSTTHMYDRKDLTHKLRRNLRTDKSIPVKWILLYMWLPKSFTDMHFTPSMIQADAIHFHEQLKQAATSSSSQVQ